MSRTNRNLLKYSRHETSASTDTGASRQRLAIKAFLRSHGVRLLQTFADDGSGDAKRARALERLKASSTVIVCKPPPAP